MMVSLTQDKIDKLKHWITLVCDSNSIDIRSVAEIVGILFYLGLLPLCKEVTGVHILLQMDNVTAVSYVRNMGEPIHCYLIT